MKLICTLSGGKHKNSNDTAVNTAQAGRGGAGCCNKIMSVLKITITMRQEGEGGGERL